MMVRAQLSFLDFAAIFYAKPQNKSGKFLSVLESLDRFSDDREVRYGEAKTIGHWLFFNVKEVKCFKAKPQWGRTYFVHFPL